MIPNREEVLFQLALEKPADKRAAFLDAMCEGDSALRHRLDALLAVHEQSEGVLAEPAPIAKPTMKIELADVPDEAVGQKIGRYKILEKVGEGGCGVVYVAEQTEPVRRRVALKVIKLGMDTKQVVARFEAERQALAMMDHPNIAKVFDAGTTDTGRPFFVMELVRGIKLTEYCDQNKLPTSQRLDLFIKVCHAIQHAHQKGIIHRDIKPSNILVTLHDGVPVPKVIDFGIAKATEGRLTDATVYTQLHQFVGTPVYMSPEQAEMSGLDIDTRSDIYSLGVLLYELLTGSTPFDGKELLSMGIDAMRKHIREKEPVRPSTKLATLHGEELTTTAKRRSVETSKLVGIVRGDLDWIVMKCLEKDRTRRYDTANGLAMDLNRHLNNEPIIARPPSTIYKFQKAFRRNKLVFTAAAAVMAALIAGLSVATVLFIQERAAHRRALAAEGEQARLRQAAEQEAAQSKIISQASLMLMRGDDNAAERIMSTNPASPSMLPLFGQLGLDHARYGNWQQAITNYEKVVQLAPNDPTAFDSLAVLAFQVGDIPAYQHWRAEILQRFGTNMFWLAKECLLAPDPEDAQPIDQMADKAVVAYGSFRGHITYSNKGWSEYRQGHFASARNWLQKATEARNFAKWDWNTPVQTLSMLAMAEYQLKDLDAAHATLIRGLQMAQDKMLKPGDDLHEDWDQWLVAHFLMREAVALMPEVTATNSAFAVLATEPPWQTALNRAGLKFSSYTLTDGTWDLRLEHQPITDLTPLRGANISRLSLNGTAVSDLSPLRGLKLNVLGIDGTKVSDLSPLEGMPLTELDLTSTPVTNLWPLRGLPLTWLKINTRALTNIDAIAEIKTLRMLVLPPHPENIVILRGMTNLARISFKYDKTINGPDKTAAEFWADYDKAQDEIQSLETAVNQMGAKFNGQKLTNGTWEVKLDSQPVTDLAQLHGWNISRLSLNHTGVTNLAPLRGMKLTRLNLDVTKVSDLSPLQGMPLEWLELTSTQVSDLSPLRGMPLTFLKMNSCTNLTSLDVIAGMKTLQMLVLPPHAKDLSFLRAMTNLTRIGFKYDSTKKGPDKTAAEFWADYDKNGSHSQSASAF